MRITFAIVALALAAVAAANEQTDRQVSQEFLGWYKT